MCNYSNRLVYSDGNFHFSNRETGNSWQFLLFSVDYQHVSAEVSSCLDQIKTILSLCKKYLHRINVAKIVENRCLVPPTVERLSLTLFQVVVYGNRTVYIRFLAPVVSSFQIEIFSHQHVGLFRIIIIARVSISRYRFNFSEI